MTEKLKLHTPNITDENVTKIAALFPHCVTEGKIDFELLKQELSSSIIDGTQERYQLGWVGKREALLTANAPIAKTLRPNREESVNFDSTENLYIEGDNLDALKLLQETYLNKVKMIYIDPPYNTGNDFIYDDDFAENTADYLQRSNQKDESGNRLTANPESNGRFHSDWLSMMYPRLKLARNLLRDDGVIFISIDDNEVHNLRKTCDEIFGEENFVCDVVWQKSKKGDAKLIASTHEYITVYVRNKSFILDSKIIWRTKKEGVDEVLSFYNELKEQLDSNHQLIEKEIANWFNSLDKDDARRAHKHYRCSDDRGLYFPDNFAGPNDGRDSRPRYDIFHPLTGKSCKKPSTGWRWEESRTKEALEADPILIHFGVDETTIPCRKSYLAKVDQEPFASVFYKDGRGASSQVDNLLGKKVFEFPKNVDVIENLLKLTTEENSIILDFFSGSATTAHAVMQLNAEDGGKRKFIMVQIPEACDEKSEAFKAGYKTISDIGKERIRRAGQKIKTDNALTATDLDIGFRVLKVDSSNMNEVYYSPDAINKDDLHLFINNIKDDRSDEDLLFQVLLDWGVDLTLPIERQTIDGKTVFVVAVNAIVACFDRNAGVTESFIKELAKIKPLRAVFCDAGFANDSVKINVEQIFKTISPMTDIKTI